MNNKLVLNKAYNIIQILSIIISNIKSWFYIT